MLVSVGRGSAAWRNTLASLLRITPGLECRLLLHATSHRTPRHAARLTSIAAQGYVQLDLWQRSLRGGVLPAPPDIECIAEAVTQDSLDQGQTLEAVRSACAGTDADVIVYLGPDAPPEWLVRASRYGTIEPWDASGPIGANATPWSRELLLGQPVVTLDIMQRAPSAPASPLRLHTATVAHRSVSPAVNAERLVTRASELLLTVVARRLGDHALPRTRPAAEGPARSLAARGLDRQPGWRRVAGQVRHRFLERGGQDGGRWHLAYRRLPTASLDAAAQLDSAIAALDAAHEFDVLTPPDGSFWADPFVIESEGRTLLYFEAQRGREPGTIAVAELLADGRLTPPRTLLEGPSHLSYPHVFAWDGQWWMIPESAVAGEVVLYRCLELPDRWQREATLLTGDQLVDCTPFADANGKWWMFASRVGVDPFPQEDLLLFSAPAPTGPWVAHAGNPLVSDVRAARPAGAVHPYRGSVLRPGQDCSVRYGYGLALHRVSRLDDAGYAESEVRRVLPPEDATEVLGVHTFNHAPGIVCVDLLLSSSRRRR